MIVGRVNSIPEAVIQFSMLGFDSQAEEVEAVIDTGFNGELTLSPELIQRLQLPFAGTRETDAFIASAKVHSRS